MFSSLICGIVALSHVAKPIGSQQGVPWQGQAGVQESVASIMLREAATPPSEQANIPHVLMHEQDVDRHGLPQNPLSPRVPQFPPAAFEAKLHGGSPRLPQTLGTSFVGPNLNESFALPPDSQGAPGPTQYLVFVNGRIRVYSKTGVVGQLDASATTFWNSVRNGEGVSDPRVRFDRLTNRWILAMITVGSPNRVMIAVSDGPTITSTTVFTFFYFQQDTVTPAGNTGELADYPTLGVDKNALYIGTNNFGSGFTGTTGFVVRKSSVLGAGPIVVTAFRNLCTNGTAGPFTPQGVDNDDPNSTEGYFIGVDNLTFGKLMIRRVSTPGGTPTISANIALTVPSTSSPSNVTPLGSSNPLDALEDRLYQAQMRLNRNTGVRTLWTAHNIEVNSSGVAQTGGGRDASRWYQIGNLSTTPTLVQSGTLFDSAATNPRNYFIPSCTMSGQGHMAIVASVAGGAMRAQIAAAGRLSSDALGATQAATIVQTTTFNYNAQASDPQRWGDYSATNVDPADDMTIWTIQEYCSATDVWAVRVMQLKAPAPAVVSTVAPTTLTQGQTMNLVITGTSVSGTGYFDPGTGFTGRLRATVSGTGVTVNSVTYTDPTHITLSVTADSGATLGSRDLTITNPDNQVTIKSGAFSVTAAGVALSSLTLSSNSVTNGTPVTGTVTLNQVTPAAFNIAVSSSNTVVASVVTPVQVAANTSSKNFTITTYPVASNTVVTITASRNGIVRTQDLTVLFGPALENLYVLPTTIKGGNPTTGVITLTAVVAAAFNVAVSSSNTAIATVPTPVQLAAGTSSKLFTVTTFATATTKNVTITAQRNSVTKTVVITVTP